MIEKEDEEEEEDQQKGAGMVCRDIWNNAGVNSRRWQKIERSGDKSSRGRKRIRDMTPPARDQGM